MSSLQRNNKLLKSSPLPVCLVMNLQRKTMSLKVHVSTIIQICQKQHPLNHSLFKERQSTQCCLVHAPQTARILGKGYRILLDNIYFFLCMLFRFFLRTIWCSFFKSSQLVTHSKMYFFFVQHVQTQMSRDISAQLRSKSKLGVATNYASDQHNANTLHFCLLQH